MGSNLTEARFEVVNLSETDWRGSEAFHLHFGRCDLSGSDWRGMNMSKVKITKCNTVGIQIDETTQLPDYFEFANNLPGARANHAQEL